MVPRAEETRVEPHLEKLTPLLDVGMFRPFPGGRLEGREQIRELFHAGLGTYRLSTATHRITSQKHTNYGRRPSTAVSASSKSTSTSASASSAWALSQVAPESGEAAAKAVPVLIDALGEPDVMTRIQAADASAAFGALAKEAAPALRKAAESENEALRGAASEALEAIRD